MFCVKTRHATYLFSKLAGDRLFLPPVSPFGKLPAEIDEAAFAQGVFHPLHVNQQRRERESAFVMRVAWLNWP